MSDDDQKVEYDTDVLHRQNQPYSQYNPNNNSTIKSISLNGKIQDTLSLAETTLRVLTLNCWGLWWMAKLRPERIRGIVRFIRDKDCDIVFLQEVWVQSDYEFIRDNTSDIYKFAHNYKSGSLLKTSGIVILSKWAPKVIHFEPYSLNGSPFYFWHGDWFAGKGVAYARVDLTDSISLHLFSTHTHAYYKENERVLDQYSIHRVCQSYQLARFINFISDTTCNRQGNSLDLIIVAGDFNCTSSEMPYKIVTSMANLTDCLKASRTNGVNSSNIIHAFKMRSSKLNQINEQQAETAIINSSDIGGIVQETVGLFTSAKQKAETFTLQDCRRKIAHLLFDSDTEDEDTTYCHPKNSFTRSKVVKTAIESDVGKTTNCIVDDKTSDTSYILSNKKVSSSGDIRFDSCNSNETSKSSGLDDLDDSNKKSSKKKRDSSMKRIDFILCRLLAHGRCVVDRITVEGKDPQLDCSLSDHEPVMVELKISHHKDTNLKPTDDNDELHGSPDGNSISNRSPRSNTNSIHSRSYVDDLFSTPPTTARGSMNKLEETTGRITPAHQFTINETYNESNLKVMEQFKDILRQYYRYNGRHKFRILMFVLFISFTILPLISYYAISNDFLPPSTIVLMWLFAMLIISTGTLAGFICYRIEQSAIEATLNDLACRINVAKFKQK